MLCLCYFMSNVFSFVPVILVHDLSGRGSGTAFLRYLRDVCSLSCFVPRCTVP